MITKINYGKMLILPFFLVACQATITSAPNPTSNSSSPSATPSSAVKASVAVNEVQVIPERLVIEAGKSGQASANVKYADNTSDSAVTWSSSDNTIASVDASTGAIKTLKSGEVTILATSTVNNSKKAGIQVSVKAPGTEAAFINVKPESLNLKAKSTATLEATAQLSNGTQSSNLTWKSSDTSIALVQGNGSQATVTAVKAGSVTITVVSDIDPKVSKNVTVTVTE